MSDIMAAQPRVPRRRPGPISRRIARRASKGPGAACCGPAWLPGLEP